MAKTLVRGGNFEALVLKKHTYYLRFPKGGWKYRNASVWLTVQAFSTLRLSGLLVKTFIAELARAKRASGAPK